MYTYQCYTTSVEKVQEKTRDFLGDALDTEFPLVFLRNKYLAI